MARFHTSRNDACPCGSRLKFKKCCLLRHSASSEPPRADSANQATHSNSLQLAGQQGRPTDELASAFDEVPDEMDDQPESPPLESVPLLPVEIHLRYSYPEPFGTAFVSYILPAGRIYFLADGTEILNDDLQVGMCVRLRDGAVATILGVELSFAPAAPPVCDQNNRRLSRVVGTIQHQGFSTVEVSWVGYSATSSPDHPYFSVSRGGYIGAKDLKVGEFLRSDGNIPTKVLAVGKPIVGMVDLFNIEVEQFHNYHVGHPGAAVLVHNSATPGNYINTRQKAIPLEPFGNALSRRERTRSSSTPTKLALFPPTRCSLS